MSRGELEVLSSTLFVVVVIVVTVVVVLVIIVVAVGTAELDQEQSVDAGPYLGIWCQIRNMTIKWEKRKSCRMSLFHFA